MTRLVDLALPVPLAKAYSYLVPDALHGRVVAGARVVCPFGSRRLVGVVLGTREGDAPSGARPLLSVVDEEPAVPSDLLAFLRDLAGYYLAPVGEVMRLALPPMEREMARALAEPTLFAEPARGVGARRVQWVAATDRVETGKLGGQASGIVALLRAAGPSPLARLEERWGNARAAVKRLTDLGLVRMEERDAQEAPFFSEAAPRDAPPEATEAQRAAIDRIVGAIASGCAATFLLHGVTGSGKTEVYLRAIAAVREQRKGAVMLVPEIALTPQLVARFRARFGDEVAVLHSALTPRERHRMWWSLRRGEVDVAIGARSALFAPVRKLGLVIVDEEHDPSFKQEEGVRYHARDMAILRAHRVSGVCVLGSATPSLESEQLARSSKAHKLVLPDRARAQAMPYVELIDLRRIGAGPTGDKRLSLPLFRALEATLAAHEQAILFLNRRGFAPSVRCEACGELAACGSCSVALTFHKRAGALVRCHYCGFETSMPARCGRCESTSIVLEGVGTEKLEETLAAAFPTARVGRLDRDVASGKAIERVIARVRSREVDILVGTQMVTKGHDLPYVTLVGVINADAALSIPDFRAAERAFQLLVQVAGRAGRGDVPGRVLVQTYDPTHPAIVFAAGHDVAGFLERELVDRKELGYPPFSRLALVRVDAVDEQEARGACAALARVAREAAASAGGKVDVLGPAPAPIARMRNRFRFRVMLRGRERGPVRRVLAAVDVARAGLGKRVRSSIDVDPVQLL
jgi:primosomal protein N' (replication factor Y)